jgi:hypothetical protein
MRRISFLIVFLVALVVNLEAQNVSTFDDLYLSTTDTFFVDYTTPTANTGFYDGLVYFPSSFTNAVYDTLYGGTDSMKIKTVVAPRWLNGFVYSNVHNTTTSDSTNQAAAITDSGFNSTTYAVAKGKQNYIRFIAVAKDKALSSVMVTNTTYVYQSLLNGLNGAKKFGGANGTDPDYLKLVIKGYGPDSFGNTVLIDTISKYLADFTADTSKPYIVHTWDSVYLSKMINVYAKDSFGHPLDKDTLYKHVDSLTFTLVSSDPGAAKLAYFCIDNLTTNESLSSVRQLSPVVAKVYPNPTTNTLYVAVQDKSIQQLMVTDMAGRLIISMPVDNPEMKINTSALTPGMYLLQLHGAGKTATVRFVKQ